MSSILREVNIEINRCFWFRWERDLEVCLLFWRFVVMRGVCAAIQGLFKWQFQLKLKTELQLKTKRLIFCLFIFRTATGLENAKILKTGFKVPENNILSLCVNNKNCEYGCEYPAHAYYKISKIACASTDNQKTRVMFWTIRKAQAHSITLSAL